jgi:ATP-binding cassette subfamily C protein/ATP-binding cassette subfamily C protein LapB
MNMRGFDATAPSLPIGAIDAPEVPGVAQSDLTRCMAALLAVSGWKGSPKDMLYALPHAVTSPDLTDIRNALALLGYPTRIVAPAGERLDPRRLPALLAPARGPVSLLYCDALGQVLRLDGSSGRVFTHADRRLKGRLYAVAEAPLPVRGSWVVHVLRRFSPEVRTLLGCSLLIALLGLGAPIFVMTVFDSVVGARSEGVLPLLLAGALGAVAAEATLRTLRQRMLSRIGERLDWLISTGVFAQLMGLPVALIDGAGRAAQVSRIRDFAAIRDFLTGAFAVAVLDLPMSLLVLALLALLGGWIVVVPTVAIAGFALLFFATRGRVERTSTAAAQAVQARDSLALEALEAQRTLKLGGAERRWAERYAEASAHAALTSAEAATAGGAAMMLAQTLVTASALGAATLGVLAVLAGEMSAGALIAGMMLIWRVLGPLQMGFVMLLRWRQTHLSIRQVDGMMTLATERSPPGAARRAAPLRGAIQFQRVVLRYPGRSEAVLSGVSFDVRHGEVVALTGPEGAGKSSILKLVAGLYAPQSGAVRVDRHDTRAYDVAVLRRAMAWVPQSPDLIYGSIAQNLRLARPDASDDALRDAARTAHVLDAIEALPQGFATRISDNDADALPRSLLVRLTLARALICEAPILLLDEAVAGLDDEAADALAALIVARRGDATILMVSHRPSHIRLADRVFRVANGQVETKPTSPTPNPTTPAAPHKARGDAPVLIRMPVFRKDGRP